MSNHNPYIPQELAQARADVADAWTAYLVACEAGAGVADAFDHAQECEAISKQWYDRWQAVGGTSDIRSIVDAEPQPVNQDLSKVAHFMQEIDMEPLDLGTHFNIQGSEVAEFGSPQWFDGIEPIEF